MLPQLWGREVGVHRITVETESLILTDALRQGLQSQGSYYRPQVTSWASSRPRPGLEDERKEVLALEKDAVQLQLGALQIGQETEAKAQRSRASHSSGHHPANICQAISVYRTCS